MPITTLLPARPLTLEQNRLNILHGGTIASMVDLGGSLAVASRGLFATGVSTDLNVTYLSSGGKIGDLIKAEVTCDKCMSGLFMPQ
jgi:acyl-coenzyme A thioesterase 13